MATYKVIQDIEAEDKLIGPLSLRQFIYAAICAACLWLTFLVVSKGLPVGAILFMPPAVVFGFLAFPWKGDQPTEVWALAKIQFLMKPRRRIWNQSGTKELVTVTAPKKVERVMTNGLSQTEVQSRLKALADTIDSRGWVVKNVNTNLYSQPGYLQDASSDRLVTVESLPQPVPTFTTQASDDMLDMQNNPVAQKFGNMIEASQKAHREEILERMKHAADAPQPSAPAPTNQASAPTPPPLPQQNYWFLNEPSQAPTVVDQNLVTFNTQVVAPGAPTNALPVSAATPTADEEAFIKQLENNPAMRPNIGHLHVIQPLSAQHAVAPQAPTPMPGPAPVPNVATAASDPAQAQSQQTAQATTNQVTPAADAAILDLARNDDLNVATIAREAQKRKESPDEVVISLH